jgi:hypothetical protein
MSEHSYFQLAANELIKARPQDFTINIAEVEAKSAAVRKQRLKDSPPKQTPPRRELEQLLAKRYQLGQDTIHSKTRVTNDTDSVRHCEKLIDGYLKAKKACVASQLLGQERFLESRLVATESELKDAQAKSKDSLRNHQACVQALSSFDGADRIAELQAELGL